MYVGKKYSVKKYTLGDPCDVVFVQGGGRWVFLIFLEGGRDKKKFSLYSYSDSIGVVDFYFFLKAFFS